MLPVILCGGSGTRLWPLSRSSFPKQFISLGKDNSSYQQTLKRLSGFVAQMNTAIPPLIVAGNEHRFLVTEQAREVREKIGSIILEPVGRNTAPALTLAALAAEATGQDPVMLVTPADHLVPNFQVFNEALLLALNEAAAGAIATLGIQPSRPETGFGYIKIEGLQTVSRVVGYVEKPNLTSAQIFLETGSYFWNSGIFLLKASIWLEAVKQFRPDILSSCQAAWGRRKVENEFVQLDKQLFERVPSESIDFAVMEPITNSGFQVKMVQLDAGWNDLGSWDAAADMLPKDEDGNAHSGDVILKSSSNNVVYASNRLVTLGDVKNMIVVETRDAILVANRSGSEEIRGITQALNDIDRDEHVFHHKVWRPWGWFDVLEEGSGFKIKRINVKPGASLSLQKHAHRSEHWVVVKGIAEVTNGEETSLYHVNQSTFIPLGNIHRLANPGDEDLEIIEVQIGVYLGEDDIVRIEDSYGRV